MTAELLLEIAAGLRWSYSHATGTKNAEWARMPDDEKLIWVAMARDAMNRMAGALRIASEATYSDAEGKLEQFGRGRITRTVPARRMAAELGITRRTLRRYVSDGIPHNRTPGGQLRFNLEEVERWMTRPKAESALEKRHLSPEQIQKAREAGRIAAVHFREWEQRRAEKRAKKAAAKASKSKP